MLGVKSDAPGAADSQGFSGTDAGKRRTLTAWYTAWGGAGVRARGARLVPFAVGYARERAGGGVRGGRGECLFRRSGGAELEFFLGKTAGKVAPPGGATGGRYARRGGAPARAGLFPTGPEHGGACVSAEAASSSQQVSAWPAPAGRLNAISRRPLSTPGMDAGWTPETTDSSCSLEHVPCGTPVRAHAERR